MSDEKIWELPCGHFITDPQLKSLWGKRSSTLPRTKQNGDSAKEQEEKKIRSRERKRNYHLEVIAEFYPQILTDPKAHFTQKDIEFVQKEVKRRMSHG